MVILGSDQLYALKNYFRRPRVFARAGKLLPAPGKDATREELRDRIVAAWRELYTGMLLDYNIQPEELPQMRTQALGQTGARVQEAAVMSDGITEGRNGQD